MHIMHAQMIAFSLDMNLKMMWYVPNVENIVIKLTWLARLSQGKCYDTFQLYLDLVIYFNANH